MGACPNVVVVSFGDDTVHGICVYIDHEWADVDVHILGSFGV